MLCSGGEVPTMGVVGVAGMPCDDMPGTGTLSEPLPGGICMDRGCLSVDAVVLVLSLRVRDDCVAPVRELAVEQAVVKGNNASRGSSNFFFSPEALLKKDARLGCSVLLLAEAVVELRPESVSLL